MQKTAGFVHWTALSLPSAYVDSIEKLTMIGPEAIALVVGVVVVVVVVGVGVVVVRVVVGVELVVAVVVNLLPPASDVPGAPPPPQATADNTRPVAAQTPTSLPLPFHRPLNVTP